MNMFERAKLWFCRGDKNLEDMISSGIITEDDILQMYLTDKMLKGEKQAILLLDKMPENCEDCSLTVWDFDEMEDYCIMTLKRDGYNREFTPREGKRADCPLLSIEMVKGDSDEKEELS